MAIYVQWRRILRRTLRVFGVITGIIVLAWLGLAWYINTHKAEILATVTATLSERMRGDFSIRTIEPSLFKSFPDVSLALKDVSLRDSMWSTHHHSLLEAKDIYVQVNPFALLSHRTEIKKITAAHGVIFLYTDTAGYSNAYLLARRDTSKKNKAALIDHFGLEDMHLWFINGAKKKLFHLYFNDLDGAAAEANGVMKVHVKADAHIFEFNFNTIRGSYLHNQDLGFDLSLDYHLANKRLEVPDQTLRIGRSPVLFSGNFYFDRVPAAFAIRVHAPSIVYRTAVSWMSPNISRNLDSFDFSKPIAIDARVSGEMQYLSIPLVNVVYEVRDNHFHTRFGDIDKMTYTGSYSNEAAPGAGHGDDNSRVAMYRLSGTWNSIPFQSDTLAVTNLLKPVVMAHIRSSFDVTAINDIVGGNVLSFSQGAAAADLRYSGGILPDDPTPYAINGSVQVTDAGLTYLPRNLVFTNVGATLLFEGDNLFFRNITLRSKQSSVAMEGEALHFLRLYFTDPGKVNLTWRTRSPVINLNDFAGFFGKRKAASARSNMPAVVSRIGTQLDRVLEASSISVDARVAKTVYKNFTADNVIARITIAESGIVLQQIQLGSGGGTLAISGMINQSAANNPFSLKANVRNADVAKLFTSFDNFGQTAITAENLRGIVTADVDVHGNVTDAGAMLKNSLSGNVTFNLENGQINRFSPFEKVSRFVFKNRNLSSVSVKDLHGKLDITGDKIFIHPMEIQTSVVNMNVQGVYGMKGGTDIYLEVPLRNPEKEAAATPIGMMLRKGKGFVVHLRAQDETGAGVKIGWDPMKHGRKATEEKLSDHP